MFSRSAAAERFAEAFTECPKEKEEIERRTESDTKHEWKTEDGKECVVNDDGWSGLEKWRRIREKDGKVKRKRTRFYRNEKEKIKEERYAYTH